MTKKQHRWVAYDGDPIAFAGIAFDSGVDYFAYEAGQYCNGPICADCGLGFCHHCKPELYQSECGQ